MSRRLTAIIQADGFGFVSHCPVLGLAGRGATIEQARDDLLESLELFFDCASPPETEGRPARGVFVTQIEVSVG
jgi:predicted RNase H-like HicB family nuclease